MINEFVKLKRFSTSAFQQMQIDINFIKYFFRENLIVDIENILDGFFLEIISNIENNTLSPKHFDETVTFLLKI
jgi:hypothetical protein